MLENLLFKIIVDYLLIEFVSFLISSIISQKIYLTNSGEARIESQRCKL